MTINAASLTTLVNDTDITAAVAESVINQAVNMLNVFGCGLSNMSGSDGTKTLAATSQQEGAIITVALIVYRTFYKGGHSGSIGSVSMNNSDLLANPVILETVKVCARELKTRRFTRA